MIAQGSDVRSVGMRVQAHEFIYEENKKSSLFKAPLFIYGVIHPSSFILSKVVAFKSEQFNLQIFYFKLS